MRFDKLTFLYLLLHILVIECNAFKSVFLDRLSCHSGTVAHRSDRYAPVLYKINTEHEFIAVLTEILQTTLKLGYNGEQPVLIFVRGQKCKDVTAHSCSHLLFSAEVAELT